METTKDSRDEKNEFTRLSYFILNHLKQGKNIDVNKQYFSSGSTALIDAVLHNDVETIQYLLDKGANINLSDRYGNTPLSLALFSRKYDAAIFLLKNGARKFTFDNYGNPCMFDLIKPIVSEGKFPKELLILLQEECPICLEEIEEIGHIYPCGHSVHNVCKVDKCPFCRK